MQSRFKKKIKFLLKEIFPPFLIRLLVRVRSELIRSEIGQLNNLSISGSADGALFERGDKPFLFLIENVRYHNGQAYNEVQHHFLRYYAGGMRELAKFYDKHQPTNVYEKHFINQPPPSQCSGHENLDSEKRISISGVPWAPLNVLKSSGEHGLDHSHGVQQYGPVSPEKITLESNRLDAVLGSIKQKGFLSRYGFVRGYLLENCSGNYKFVVTGGQHRMAALAFLGEEKVPVMFQARWPRVIKRSEVHKWPHVLAGNVSHQDALRIFDSYFRSDDLPLW